MPVICPVRRSAVPVGEGRAARMAGSGPARTPMMTATASREPGLLPCRFRFPAMVRETVRVLARSGPLRARIHYDDALLADGE